MNFAEGQLMIILAPYIDFEIYATVERFDKDVMILEMKSTVDVPYNTDILCIVIEPESMFEFYTQVITRKGNRIYAKLPDLNEYSPLEKRRFNRADCNISFVATPVSISNVSLKDRDRKFMGVIKNISGGGVKIETNLNLPIGLVFSFKLKLDFFLDCRAEVVRTTAIDNDTFESGCKFVQCSLEDIKAIALYAFKESLNLRRKDLKQAD